MTLSSRGDHAGLRRAGAVVAETLQAMEAAARPGIRTDELDQVAARIFRRHGARSAPQLAYAFPGSTCISVNEEIVHGIPGDRVLAARDVVKLDVTAELDGYVADAAVTVLIPPAQPVARRLRKCVRRAFERPARVVEEPDGWTLRTHNRTLAAHYEHTIVITAAGAEVVTRLAA
jgi:methionyl aminopeptidase